MVLLGVGARDAYRREGGHLVSVLAILATMATEMAVFSEGVHHLCVGHLRLTLGRLREATSTSHR